MIVVDASVAAEWYLFQRRDEFAHAALLEVSRAGGVAPGNFYVETLEALLRGARHASIMPDDLASATTHLTSLDVRIVFPSLGSIAVLAQKHALSAYDAGYLAAAKMRSLALATVDTDLARAAEAEGCLWTPPPPHEVEKRFSLLLAG